MRQTFVLFCFLFSTTINIITAYLVPNVPIRIKLLYFTSITLTRHTTQTTETYRNEMTAFENLSTTQKLRASLHRDVRSICTEALHMLGMEMTKPAMEIVAELVYKKLAIYGTDLEAFAKHAKRNTVNSEDVKLLVRRNPCLKSHLNKIQPSIQTKEKRRKTVVSTSKLTTPLAKPKERNSEDRHDESARETEFQEKESERKECSISEESMENKISEVEEMSVDDAIVDLTFD